MSPEATYRETEREFVSGNLLAAAQTAEGALRQYAVSDPLWSTRFRIELAKVWLYQGHFADVMSILREPLLAGSPVELVIQRDVLLAFAESRMGTFDVAERTLAEARALHPAPEQIAEVQRVEGQIALGQDHLDEAERLFQAALEGGSSKGAEFLETQVWMNLGVISLRERHYEDALERFNHASALARSIGNKQALEKALGNLGWIYYQTGDYVRALADSKAAAAQAAALGSAVDEVQLMTNVGMSQSKLNDLVAARASYERALQLADGLHNPEVMFDAHVALASLLLRSEPAAAEDHIHEATRLAHLRQTEDWEPALLEALLLMGKGDLRAAEAELLGLAGHTDIPPGVQWEAENTLGTVYAQTGQTQEAERWFRRAIDTFHRQRLSVKSIELQLPFLENGNDLYMGYMEFMIRQHRTDEALNILDGSRAETLAEGLGVATSGGGVSARLVAARALAARLHGTILVYCLQPEASHLWAISATKQEFYALPGSTTILPLVERHTQAILASKDLLVQKDSTGRALYDALLKPAEGLIGTGGRVFIIADKGMTGLNFETLIPPGEQPHYWIEDATITNARSLRLLSGVKERLRPGRPQRVLLMGDPVYRPDEYALLPNAAAEMTGVASHFAVERRAVFAGRQASPVSYAASGPGKFAYIHFVAHATANEANPLDSAIILSSPGLASSGGSAAAYKLYARDILRQPLDTELVTISSCYGTGVRNYSGEGVVGLVWAFLRAGAHSVIGAMWEVSDVSTPQLMDALYTELLAGSRPDAALRSAKLAMLHRGGVFRKPLYWASFQLYSGR